MVTLPNIMTTHLLPSHYLALLLSLVFVSCAYAKEAAWCDGHLVSPLSPRWEIIPETPRLPNSIQSGYVSSEKARIWYAVFGKGHPVVLLHGGLTQSNYWGNLISDLQKYYQVIVIDSRGHGRSTLGRKPLSYHLMANDVLAVMDHLKIQKAAVVGWSDGANIGLDMAIYHPHRISSLFAFSANVRPEAAMDVSRCPSFAAFSKRIKDEYQTLSPTPTDKNYQQLIHAVSQLWETTPAFSETQLQRISIPVLIATGDHDEGIMRSHTEFLAHIIPHAELLIESNVAHFALLQDPVRFNSDVAHFLSRHWN